MSAIRRACFALLSCALLTAACACAGGTERRQPVATDFTCTVNATYNDMQVKGYLQRYTAGSLRIDIEEPSTLKGMAMEWDGEKVTVSMLGLSFDLDPDDVPESALGRVLGAALDSAITLDKDALNNGEATSEGYLIYGSCAAGDYEIVTDPDTGLVKSIRVPSQALEAEFTDVTTGDAAE